MKRQAVTLTKRGREQEECPLVGIGAGVYIATLAWPSLGITPDRPEWGIRTAAGPLAFSRDRDALVAWANRNYIHIHNDDDELNEEEG